MEKIIIVSQDDEGTGQFEWREVYNGDKYSEEEAIQKYMEDWSVEDRAELEAHTVDIKHIC